MLGRAPIWLLALPLLSGAAQAQPSAPSPAAAAPTDEQVFAGGLRAYHAALLQRHLGQSELRLENVTRRVAEGEELIAAGRIDEAIASLVDMVEDPQFELFADSEGGRAAVFRLGDALAIAGLFEPARAYLRRILEAKGAWQGADPAHAWPRRAVRRLVDMALETGAFAAARDDLAHVPATAPEEVRGELAYLDGRAQEAAANPEDALAAYALVTPRCRFWAHATYLAALIHVEKGRYREGEGLLCKLADPKRSASTTPILADEKFFIVRDLARLGLGRIAHEQGRNDDARYYYYLVPEDSDRLAEALYESATTRYEKKDYDGAAELLRELSALGVHSRYEDEAHVLSAWVDLARCRFAEADRELVEFLKRYEPVRDGARRIAESDAATGRLLAAVHAGTDAAGAEVGGMTVDVVRIIAALVRVEPSYDHVLRRRAVLEREASGLVATAAVLRDLQRALATNGGVRPAAEVRSEPSRKERLIEEALSGVDHEMADLQAARAPEAQLGVLRDQLASLKAQARGRGAEGRTAASAASPGADLSDLLRVDTGRISELQNRVAAARNELDEAESILAKDALRRLDLRLSRLLRRARLGRIESVLGRKRALEVEVEAIRMGYLPTDAVDSLDAARYLEDSEEYWPFEGDDWPDEYVGGETK